MGRNAWVQFSTVQNISPLYSARPTKVLVKWVPASISTKDILLFFLVIFGAIVEPDPLLLRPFIGLLYQPWMIDGDDCGAIGGMNEL
jgi:hypothetical protein